MSDPSLAWLAAGFGIAWVLLAGYVLRLWRAQRELQERFTELERKRGPHELG